MARLASGLEPDPNRVILFSDEWKKRREQCQAFLRARAGLFDRRVGARSCAVTEVPRYSASDFLEAHHLQGASRLSLITFGLYKDADLLGVLSMGRHTRQDQDGLVVLDRLCFAPGVQVVGGASRLLARAISWAKRRGYDQITSFSDHRLTPGIVYERLGFARERIYKPDYFYVRGGCRISKQSQQKRCTGCPVDVTEWEWATQHGLVRCYDAGKTRWVYDLKPGVLLAKKQANSERTAKLHAAGVFKHSHMRGYFKSDKNAGEVYFGSSYELRCLFELEQDPSVRSFGRCEAFQTPAGNWRNPDLQVEFVDGRVEVWEVKPSIIVDRGGARAQLIDSIIYTSERGVPLRIWTEKNSSLGNEQAIVKWARNYLADQQDDPHYLERQKKQRKAIRERHYAKEQAASVTVYCDYCKKEHVVLPRTYARNVARNGVYTCEAMAGRKGGSKPKDHRKKTNPYAVDEKKECCRCHAVLPFADFDRRSRSWDGLSSVCKACCSVNNAARYQAKKARFFC